MVKTIFLVVILALPLCAATLTVGPDKQFATPCAAVTASADGDRIEVDAGLYLNDFCVVIDKALTLAGVGGRAHVRGQVKPTKYQGAAVWVVDTNGRLVTFENFEFSGGRGNGNTAALRYYPGSNGVLRNVVLHDSENCLMQSGVADSLVVEDSEFFGCGTGTGQTHNIYVDRLKRFVFRRSYSHDVNVGHTLKSRADITIVDESRLVGGGSFEVDCSQAGDCRIVNSEIEQLATAVNMHILAAGNELPILAPNTLTISGSTITDWRPGGKLVLGNSDLKCTMTNSKYLHTGGTVGTCLDGGGNTIAPLGSPTSAITWRLVSGALPPGLALAADGSLSGLPTQAGTYKFVVEATSPGAAPATREYTIAISGAPTPEVKVTITTSSLPDGTVGVSYSVRLAATT